VGELAAIGVGIILLYLGLLAVFVAFRRNKHFIAKMETRRELRRPDTEGHLVWGEDGTFLPGLCHCNRKQAHQAVWPQQTREP
jgi:hypothetical protein